MPHDRENRTPLERFIDVLQSRDPENPPENILPHGWHLILAGVRAALPFLPSIVAFGQWPDSCDDGATAQAIDAAAVALSGQDDKADDDPIENIYTEDLEARYYVGLLVGLALAHALQGTKATMGANSVLEQNLAEA